MTEGNKLLEVEGLCKWFPLYGGVLKREVARLHAVGGVNFYVKDGETLGLVGESGCGKSTVGRTLLRLYEADAGKVIFDGKNMADLDKTQLREVRRNLQMIFQDPYESLNSRMTIRQILMEPYEIHKIGDSKYRENEIQRLLARVGLSPSAADKYPHEFSGGQRQRVGIARAIALKPKLIICDEPVSALDVSIQSQVINLLLELQEELGLSYVFIAHDLSVVRHVSDRVAVMYLGEIVEYTDADTIYEKPMHPYTKALISAIPEVRPSSSKERIVLEGEVPSPITPPSGCRFHPRCSYVTARCKTEKPEYRRLDAAEEHFVACHRAEQILHDLN